MNIENHLGINMVFPDFTS